MSTSAGVAQITTTNARPGSVHDVAVATKRKVTYLFDTGATGGTVKIPYCIAVAGSIVMGVAKPERLQHKKAFSVLVEPGQEVGLYLNSDAHPDHRKQLVYKVTPDERDVYVLITEETGKMTDTDSPVFVKTEGKPGQQVDKYTAKLTGDIWMKISHKYTRAEAEGLVPSSADAGVRNAVLTIYDVLTASTLTMHCTSPVGHDVTITFQDSNNPKNNINSYELRRDGLPRVHPLGLYAIFEAARKASCTALTVSSCWRPLLGSIAHRAGLGLDVSYLEDSEKKISVNRQELRGGKDVEWVSEEEKRLFKLYESAETSANTAALSLKSAENSLIAAQKKRP